MEDRILLDLLAELERAAPTGEAADREKVRRGYLETLGLLPYALEPRAPSAGLKRRLLASLAPAPSAAGDLPTVAFEPQPRAGRSSSWALPLAAVLALALFAFSAWQFVRLGRQGEEIARLTADLEALGRQRFELAETRSRLEESRAQVAMLASPGAEYCVLKPVAESPASADAWGVFVVSSDRGNWFLRVSGLAPCAQGRKYRLWLVTADSVIQAATFDGHPAAGSIDLSSEDVPDGIRAVSITLEHEGAVERPTGPSVLFADQAMQLL